MRLNDYTVELVKDLILILGELAKCKNQVLRRHAARLDAGKEHSEAFVDNSDRSILEVIINQ